MLSRMNVTNADEKRQILQEFHNDESIGGYCGTVSEPFICKSQSKILLEGNV